MTPRDIVALVQSIVVTLLALGGVVWGAARLLSSRSATEAREGATLSASVEHLREVLGEVRAEVLGEVRAMRSELRPLPLHAARIEALETEVKGLRSHCTQCSRDVIAHLADIARKEN